MASSDNSQAVNKSRKTTASSSPRQKVHQPEPDFTGLEWTDGIKPCPTFNPSVEEFKDPYSYIQSVAQGASSYGICKIIPPFQVSVPDRNVLNKVLKKFRTTFQPLKLAKWTKDNKPIFLEATKYRNYMEFKKKATDAFKLQFPDTKSPPSSNVVEKTFWSTMAHGNRKDVEYGSNISESLFSCDPNDELGASDWNLKTFAQLPRSILSLLEKSIPGTSEPMLYIGMLFSMFAWNVEDHYLYSINYHHCGAPKTWYVVPGDEALKFERVVMYQVYTDDIRSAYGENGALKVLAEQTTMFPPNILLQNDVDVYKAIQMPGEFIITFPRAYYSGFCHGLSCGEAVNFATRDWFPFGAMARWRYAQLNRLGNLPYERFLCKEAITLFKSSNDEDSDLHVKIQLVYLMQFYNRAFDRLKLQMRIWPFRESRVIPICSSCKRDCYLAYIWCHHDTCDHAKCLFHDIDTDSPQCPCGNSYYLCQMDQVLPTLQNAAQNFERDQKIQQYIQRETQGGNEIILPPEYNCLP